MWKISNRYAALWGAPQCHHLLVLACFTLIAAPAHGAQCASPGRDGTATISSVVNTYWDGTSNPAAGATSLALGASSGASDDIAVGDLLMFIQMQDANISRANNNRYGDNVASDPANGYRVIRRAGNYEFARATNAIPSSGGTLTISSGLIYDYTNSAATGTRGQRTFQIVRVPQYVDATIAGTLSAAPWDGSKGGIVAIDVAGTLTFSGGSIDVSGDGFRGGGGRNSTTGSGAATDYRTPFTNGANGSKGEGIAGTPQLVWDGSTVTDTGIDGYPNGSFARGAPANGGGGGTDGNPASNSENTGGGGGGGYGDGGRGGHGWCSTAPTGCDETGGHGGGGIGVLDVARLTLGGGGGAGSMNNNTGTPNNGGAASGERGGGIIHIRADRITGTGSLSANGIDANDTVDNDGSGGGGAGGSIVIDAEDTTGLSLTVSAEGGDGGSNRNSAAHGPGGGGGGGYIGFSTGVTGLSTTVSSGAAGDTDNGSGGPLINYGAEDGSSGTSTSITPASIPGFSSGDECIIEIEKSFSPNTATIGTPVRLTLTLTNPNPDLAMSSLNITDTYPADMENAATPDVVTDCTGTVTAGAGADSAALTGGGLAAGASCTIEVDVIGTADGAHLNEVAIGGANASISAHTVQNIVAAQDTLAITLPLTANKTVTTYSDPINGTTDPYTLPGAIMEYTITFNNPSAVEIDAGTIVITDKIPDDTDFSNVVIAAGLPIALDAGASGLSLVAANITYSYDGGASFISTPPTGTIDPTVSHIRVSPTGAMAASSSAAIRFRVELD